MTGSVMTIRYSPELLGSLRDNGDPALRERADRLQELYHARQYAALAVDVYDAASGRGKAPHGWIRASENPELLRAALPELGISESRLRGLLKPAESGFRAELYIPDPAVLGPDVTATLVFKGS